MILGDVLKGLQLSPWVIVSLIDVDTDKYLKGGYVPEVMDRYYNYHVIRTVISTDGILRFFVRD